MHAIAIVNPAAGGRSVHRERSKIHDRIIGTGLLCDYVFTDGPGHATELAREAIQREYPYIISVGGDGTVNEVANGIIDS